MGLSHSKDQSAPTAAQQQQPPVALQQAPVAFRLDAREADTSALMLNGALLDALKAAMPPTQQTHWKLLYSSRLHGKNFTQLVKRLRKRGPTLIVIHETATELGDAGRVFGGYCNSEWRLVSDREHEAKANAAAKLRSDICKQSGLVGESFDVKPDKQAKQFFGDNQSFVFTSGTLKDGAWSDAYDPDAVRLYRSRASNPEGNANYMYLMDAHPQTDRIGLGMGSDKADGVGEFAWFIDRYLGRGRCSARLCPTFSNPRLSAGTDFGVVEVEAYGVDGDALDAEGGIDGDDDRDDRPLNERHAIDKKLLELAGRKFYSDEPREEC